MQNPENLPFSQRQIQIATQIIKSAPSQLSLTQLITAAIDQQLGLQCSSIHVQNLIQHIRKKKLEEIQNEDLQKSHRPSIPLFTSFASDQKNQAGNLLSHKTTSRAVPSQYRSGRRITPKEDREKNNCSLEERLKEIEMINEDCTLTIDKFDRKLNKKLLIPEPNTINQKQVWFFNQYFYSNYDRTFFNRNHFNQILTHLGIESPISFSELKKIHQALPKPNILTPNFIRNQKQLLEEHRISCRQKSKLLSKHNQITDFAVHSVVLALHPMCGHLHLGSILAFYKQNQYMVKFSKPELPTHKICDTHMSTEYTNSGHRENRGDVQREKVTKIQLENQVSQIVESINFDMMAFLIKILALKSDLIKQIRKINDCATAQQELEETYKIEDEKKKIDWLVTYLKQLEVLISKALILFRLRYRNNQNSGKILSNISNLLLNPLKLMSKEFESSSEEMDIRAASQIKQIIKRQRQNEVNSAISKIESKIEKQLKEEQSNFMKQCLLLLSDLRSEGKKFDLTDNLNLKKLVQLTNEQNLGEQFNEAYERIFSIVTKVKD